MASLLKARQAVTKCLGMRLHDSQALVLGLSLPQIHPRIEGIVDRKPG